ASRVADVFLYAGAHGGAGGLIEGDVCEVAAIEVQGVKTRGGVVDVECDGLVGVGGESGGIAVEREACGRPVAGGAPDSAIVTDVAFVDGQRWQRSCHGRQQQGAANDACLVKLNHDL